LHLPANNNKHCGACIARIAAAGLVIQTKTLGNVLEIWQLGLLSAAGVVAGFLNVMAGGGSLLTVPIMVFMGIPGPVANGTNRIAILAQNITAATTFFKRGYAEFRLSLPWRPVPCPARSPVPCWVRGSMASGSTEPWLSSWWV
jgi:hypothetical protein